MSSTVHQDDNIAIYALGALTGEERSVLEAHLRGCARCRALLGEARATVNLLPRSVEPMVPSPGAKRRLFARVDADLAQTAAAAPRIRHAPGTAAPRFRLPLTRSLAFGLLAAVFVIIVFIAAVPFLGRLEQQREIAAILSNPNAQTRVIAGTKDAPAAQGKLIAAPGDTRAVLSVEGLLPLPADKTYEFWLIGGTKPVPSGLFNVDANGNTTLLVTASQSIGEFDKLGVTIEQRAGEQSPKGTLVMEAGF